MYSRGFALTVNFANRFYLRIRNLRDHLPAAYNMLCSHCSLIADAGFFYIADRQSHTEDKNKQQRQKILFFSLSR